MAKPTITNPTTAELLAAECGITVQFDHMPALVVHRRAGIVGSSCETVTLTSDGRHYNIDGWHTGPEADWVYVERHGLAGREFHGFIDSASRKLTQAG